MHSRSKEKNPNLCRADPSGLRSKAKQARVRNLGLLCRLCPVGNVKCETYLIFNISFNIRCTIQVFI